MILLQEIMDLKIPPTQIPVNIGIGLTASLIGKLKVDSLLQFQYMAYQNATKKAGFVNHYTNFI